MCYDGCSRGESSKHRRIHLHPCASSRASSSNGNWQDAQFKEAFDLMDRDGDGTIKPSDLMFFLQNSLKSDDLCHEDVESMIKFADRDGSGAVDFEEFLSLVQQPRISAPRSPSLETRALEEIFRVLDRNGDGVLSEDDLSGAVETLGQDLSHEEVLGMLQIATGSERRNVTFQDFCLLMSTALVQ